jgi:hypothetical protein
MQLPAADSPMFHAEMVALWRGVQSSSLKRAMPAFFPEAAYAQVKEIADPKGDYLGRLVEDYRLDIAAAHQLLGSGVDRARLIRVRSLRDSAHWVAPGACYNRVGYYEVPNSRVVYREGGELRSFGIASMISWRGVWYVIHLGAVLRSAAVGVVDDPSVGSGSPVPSSTC